MASTEPADDSAAARQRGNDFYRKGQFAQAQRAYSEAAELAPEDPAPWSNMSAIRFELGNYSAALENLDKALELSSDEPDDGPKKQKLYARKAKCHLHALALDEAAAAAKHLGDDDASKALRNAIGDAQKLWAALPDEAAVRKQILDRLPRYRSQIQDVPEYYAVGHDDAESLLDLELQLAIGNGGDVSFLMCGSGDARHLFATLLELFRMDMGSGGKKLGKAHFTLVDINAAALARTLVIFDMLFIYTVLKRQKMPRVEDALVVISYIYSSPFVPEFVEMKVLESIRTLIDEFERDKDLPASAVLDTLWVPKATRDLVLRKLKQWAEPLGEAYTAKKLRGPIVKRFRRTQQQMEAAMGGLPPGPGAKNTQNEDDFSKLGAIFPNKAFLERRDPDLLPLLDAYRKKGSGAAAQKALEAHLDTKWRVNMTMLDMDYEPRRAIEASPGTDPMELLPVLDTDPNKVAGWLNPGTHPGKNSSGALDDIGTFFDTAAVSSLSLLGRVHIELIAGEMADVMERIRYDTLEHRVPGASAPSKRPVDPSKFPREYDRIHMSNIPDYVGGPLTTHMYAGPLLRSGRPSNLRFNNLLNPPMFASHEQFLAEYVLMHDERQLADHFGLARQQAPKKPGEDEMMARLMASAMGAQYGFATEDYFIWAPAGPKRVPRERLMSRPAMEHWLYSHLLKICIPHNRPVWSDRPVHAPLNLTAFLRLVALLHSVGYPAHWLSGVLEAAATGAITTTARPPRRLVLTVDDVAKRHPSRRISLGPWKAELTTLLSLWRRILGFGIVAPSLPAASAVIECAVTFPEFLHEAGRVPHFIVAFFHESALTSMGSIELPAMIQDDEQGSDAQGVKAFREKGCHLVTAFRYVTDTRTATFWMREDVVGELMQGMEWAVCICRTDVWDVSRNSLSPVSKTLRSLGAWTR